MQKLEVDSLAGVDAKELARIGKTIFRNLVPGETVSIMAYKIDDDENLDGYIVAVTRCTNGSWEFSLGPIFEHADFVDREKSLLCFLGWSIPKLSGVVRRSAPFINLPECGETRFVETLVKSFNDASILFPADGVQSFAILEDFAGFKNHKVLSGIVDRASSEKFLAKAGSALLAYIPDYSSQLAELLSPDDLLGVKKLREFEEKISESGISFCVATCYAGVPRQLFMCVRAQDDIWVCEWTGEEFRALDAATANHLYVESHVEPETDFHLTLPKPVPAVLAERLWPGVLAALKNWMTKG